MKIFILVLLNLALFACPIQAVSPTLGDTVDTNKVEDITDKLKEIVKSTSTEQEPISNQPKSFFGTITQINDNLMVIISDNQNKILQLSDETICINSNRQKIKASEFKVGQTILAMGYFNQDNSLDCRRIIATDSKSVENNNQIITGQIVDVPQSQTSIFAFTPFQNKDIQYQIKVDSKTEIIDTNQKKLKSSETIIKGKKIIIVMHPDTKNSQTFYATSIISLESEPPSPTTNP
jgi:hypothetical protein